MGTLIDDMRSSKHTLYKPRTLDFVPLETYELKRYVLHEDGTQSLNIVETGDCRRSPAYREQLLEVFEYREIDRPVYILTLEQETIIKESDIVTIDGVNYQVLDTPVYKLESITRVYIRESDII